MAKWQLKGGVSKLFGGGRTWIIIACALLGAVLLLFGDSSKNEPMIIEGESGDLAVYGKEVEAKILELCSRVEGVKNVSVAVSFESGFEYIYATDGDKTLTVGSGSSESAVRVTEKPPTISGIGIVCTGGGDPRIQQKLINLLSAAYGISSNKIYITEAQK
jgi:stage III sporulation protein AG